MICVDEMVRGRHDGLKGIRENGLYSTVLYNQDRYGKVYFDEYYIHNIFASIFHDRCSTVQFM
jgi:hypothetical protein